MGTRSSTLVKSNGKIKVAQYCQWDGYPTGVGKDIAEFLNEEGLDLADFKAKVDALGEITEEMRSGIVAGHEQYLIGANTDWTESYPQLDRGVGAAVLKMIADGKVDKVFLDEDFREDTLFCEYWYEINLDDNTITHYGSYGKGTKTYPLSEWTEELMEKLESDDPENENE